MRKVIKLFLHNGFTPINPLTLKVGTCLDFDCYIQRFNGFVIVIEKGTLFDEAIHQKVTKNNLPIYVANKSYTKYKDYNIEHNGALQFPKINQKESLTLDDEIQKALSLKDHLAEASNINTQLKIIYTCAKNILNAWLEQETKKTIPIEALNYIVETLVSMVMKEEVTFSKFNNFLDTQDSLGAHCTKVSFFALLIGHEIGLDFEDQRKLTLAAILHDIGKCEIHESLLNKPDVLTELEHKMVQIHSEESVKLVRKSGLKDRHIVAAIRDHHERLDGSGYPSGLSGKRISQFGKIIAVCDVFDSLITIKTYRGAYTTFNALSLIRSENKHKLDTSFINILIKLLM